MYRNIVNCTATLAFMFVTASLAGGQPLDLGLAVPREVDAYAPIWVTLELTAAPGFATETDPFEAELPPGLDPGIVLYDARTRREVPSLGRHPRRLESPTAAFGSGFYHPVYLTGPGTYRERYLLQHKYGRLRPGEYEIVLRLQFSALGEPRAGLAGTLLGSGTRRTTMDEKGAITHTPGFGWQLPEKRAAFRVTAAAEDRADAIMSRVSEMIQQGRNKHVAVDDWLSLALIDNNAAWTLLTGHLADVPRPALDMASISLLNPSNPEIALGRARRLLSSPSPLMSEAAVEAIEKLGQPRDAMLLRDYLLSDGHMHRSTAYRAIAQLLDKPLPEGFTPSHADFETARGWLRELDHSLEP